MKFKICIIYNNKLTLEYSQIFYNKLKNQFPSLIINLIEDNIINTPCFIIFKHNKEILKLEGKIDYEIICQQLKNIGL